MTLQQFHELNEMEKVCAIMQSGRLMTQNVEGNTRIFLYRFETFYVYACYSTLNDQLTEIMAYVDLNKLLPRFRIFLTSINPAEREYETPEL